MSHVDWGMLLLNLQRLLLDISQGFHCQVGPMDHGWLSPAGLTHQLLWCVVFVSGSVLHIGVSDRAGVAAGDLAGVRICGRAAVVGSRNVSAARPARRRRGTAT